MRLWPRTRKMPNTDNEVEGALKVSDEMLINSVATTFNVVGSFHPIPW